jgi:hypothetical protein
MKHIFAKYTAGSVLCVAFLMTGTAALSQDSKPQGTQSAAKQGQPPSLEPGPGPTSSRSDTTGTPGLMSEQKGKSAKEQIKECVANSRAHNTTVSEADAKKACQEAMKSKKDNPHQEQPK